MTKLKAISSLLFVLALALVVGYLPARADSMSAPWPVFRLDQSTPGVTNGVRSDSTGAIGSAVPSRAEYNAGVGSGNLIGMTVCDSSIQLQMTTATTTQLVGLVASKKVRVCGYQVQGSTTATASTLQFVYGTGAACGTGTTAITPAWTMPATTTSLPASYAAGLGEIFQTPVSNALCATQVGAGTVNMLVTFTQY